MKNKPKSLQHLLDVSNPYDKQIIYTDLVNSLCHGHESEITLRRSAKISLDGSDEEIINSISEILKIPKEFIDIEEIRKQFTENRKSSLETISIIEDYLDFLESSNASDDKIEEAYDLGKFLKKYDPNAVLVIPSSIDQIPDFVIISEGKKIGIEHTRMMDRETQKIIGTILKIVAKTKKQLELEASTSKLLINISFNFSKIILEGKTLVDQLSQNQIKNIATKLSKYLINYCKSNGSDIPDYIDNISISKTDHPTEIYFNENYLKKVNSSALLKQTIIKKEKKLPSYQTNSQLDEFWLLVISSGMKSSSSFDIGGINNIKSSFCKVFVMDNFNSELVQVN